MVKVLRSFVRGPLSPHVAGFAEELLRQGYSRSSAEQHVCFIAHLDRWMQAKGVGLGDLSGQVLERYLAERRATGYREYRSVNALRPLRDYLVPLGAVPVPARVRLGPVEDLLARYRGRLLRERGLTAGTVPGYTSTACGRSSSLACAVTCSTLSAEPQPMSRFRSDYLSWLGHRVGEADRVRIGVAAGLVACHRSGSGVVGRRGAVGGGLATVKLTERA